MYFVICFVRSFCLTDLLTYFLYVVRSFWFSFVIAFCMVFFSVSSARFLSLCLSLIMYLFRYLVPSLFISLCRYFFVSFVSYCGLLLYIFL